MTRTVHSDAATFPYNIEIEGRGIGLRIFVTDYLENIFFKKRRVLRQEYIKMIFMTIFIIDCVRQCFLIKFYQIKSINSYFLRNS